MKLALLALATGSALALTMPAAASAHAWRRPPTYVVTYRPHYVRRVVVVRERVWRPVYHQVHYDAPWRAYRAAAVSYDPIWSERGRWRHRPCRHPWRDDDYPGDW